MDELLSTNDSFISRESFRFSGEVGLPESEDCLSVALDSTLDSSVLLRPSVSGDESQILDAFGSNSHAWSELDAVVPDFSFAERQQP